VYLYNINKKTNGIEEVCHFIIEYYRSRNPS